MFRKLVGNDDIKHRLKRLIAERRVPNSLLFAGDEGVGKRQFALEIAKTFVCTDAETEHACNVCSACQRADRLVIPEREDKNKDEFKKVFFSEHLDVGTVVHFKRTILVDAIRDLERNANFRPYESPARFFIIDEADRMNDESSNALLKTLEEPPPTSFIFLITSRPDSLLPTIRSRCQILRFAPVENSRVESYLIEERAYSHDEARLAARLSRGSIGRAVSINVKSFREQRELMLDVLVNVVRNKDKASLLMISEQMNDAKNKERFEENLAILESLIHDLWSLTIGGDHDRLANSDLAGELEQLTSAARKADLPAWLSGISQLRDDLAVNINRRVASDALFVSMANA